MKTKEPLKEQYPEMINEEYRIELKKILDETEDNNLLYNFHRYATQQISSRAVDYHALNSGYRDMIIENSVVRKRNLQQIQEMLQMVSDAEIARMMAYIKCLYFD